MLVGYSHLEKSIGITEYCERNLTIMQLFFYKKHILILRMKIDRLIF